MEVAQAPNLLPPADAPTMIAWGAFEFQLLNLREVQLQLRLAAEIVAALQTTLLEQRLRLSDEQHLRLSVGLFLRLADEIELHFLV